MSVRKEVLPTLRVDVARAIAWSRAEPDAPTPSLLQMAYWALSRPFVGTVILFRLMEYFDLRGRHHLARLCYAKNLRAHGCDLAPGLRAGPGLVIPHPVGVVAAASARLGARVTLHQNSTLGLKRTPEKHGAAPRLADGVTVSAGAVVLGGVLLGEGAVIGANAVVTSDVPAWHLAVGIPARTRPLVDSGTESHALA